MLRDRPLHADGYHCAAKEHLRPTPPETEINRSVLTVPPATGAEYLTADVLEALWLEMDTAFCIELAKSGCGVQEFLKRRNPAWYQAAARRPQIHPQDCV